MNFTVFGVRKRKDETNRMRSCKIEPLRVANLKAECTVTTAPTACLLSTCTVLVLYIDRGYNVIQIVSRKRTHGGFCDSQRWQVWNAYKRWHWASIRAKNGGTLRDQMIGFLRGKLCRSAEGVLEHGVGRMIFCLFLRLAWWVVRHVRVP